ncbi:unnamed protein product [Phytophthora fragariaefolia]|uniref:Unnamed protein product n=1 Tax=Phytophthora fragariaefolia TaxID=1490495 RepID=A0A9W7D6M7_9STRA|nr:unnamed protein product [Phytophthora fragariaefolia]
MPVTTRRMADAGETVVQPPAKRLKTTSDDNDDTTWDEWVQRMEVGDENDPGIAIDWADDDELHACLGVVGAPTRQRATAAASATALKAWFSRLVVAQNRNAPVKVRGTPSLMFFHHLSLDEYGAIHEALHARRIMAWWAPLDAAGLSAGAFFMVTDGGRGRNEAMHQTMVPFL